MKKWIYQEDGFQLLKKTRGGDWGRPRIGKSYGGCQKIIVAARCKDHDVELEGIPFGVVERMVLDIKKRFVLRLIQVYPIKCTVMFRIPAIMEWRPLITASFFIAENWRLKL